MKLTVVLAASVLLSLAPAAAIREDVSIAEHDVGQADTVCTLHVWPSQGLRSTYSGWLHGSLVDGAVDGRDGYEELPKNVLPPEVQIKLLGALDLAAILGADGSIVTIHETPLPSRVIRATRGRILAGDEACYAEFIVDDVFFQEDLVDGRFLKAIFRFRRFEMSNEPSASFGTFIQRRLKVFPPKSPEENEAALAEFHGEFGNAIREFGTAMANPGKRRKRK